MRPVDPFDDAATARAVVDAHGVLVEWNEGAQRLLGWAPGEVLGRPAADLVAGDARPVLPDEPRSQGTVTLRHRDGHDVRVWVLIHHWKADSWLLVTPLEGGGPPDPGDALSAARLLQSPCPVALYDERLRLRRMNGAMAELLRVPEERLRGLRLSEIDGRPDGEDIERHMRQVFTSGLGHDMRTYLPMGEGGGAGAWLASMSPITDADGQVRGVCVAAHDFSEYYRARERLQLVNEASVTIGTTLDVTRTAEELADVCVPALADFVGVNLLAGDEQDGDGGRAGPPRAPVALRRCAVRSVVPGDPGIVPGPGQVEVYPASSPEAVCLTTGRSLLLSRQLDDPKKWLAWNPRLGSLASELGIHSMMAVPLRARGTALGVTVFVRWRQSAPFTADDVLLAEEVTARAAICIDNARRYSHERETALALQRSLLPEHLPRTAAVDAACRYLPATRIGVGGDWFDVIPLSGMRVALVVGDVVGRGVQASATMGRLRTAVRTLADIDLAPDELLTHLDDLVVRMSGEAGDTSSAAAVGATCLYAVYDPISRRCTLARAGHPAPVLVPPGGPARSVELPSGRALGTGGLPFESAVLDLAEGSLLSFHTDGLLESHDGDAVAGHRLLCEALTAHSGSLDEICDRVIETLLPAGGAADDVALLVARTRGLPDSQVATWDIPADPALVAPVRKQVLDRLAEWGLEEVAFITELVVSELVTNAIRYGLPPIRLRLIHDEAQLICEVSDASHTAPHLRRAKTWDEGGRGLLLVAQLTRRWGSRHTSEGKTIWAELSLDRDAD
ncbi:SpoIIE family protein phosphatase [Streptomyces sp. NPDC003374]